MWIVPLQARATLTEVVKTWLKMLMRFDGQLVQEQFLGKLPGFLGREFCKCRVPERAEFVNSLAKLVRLYAFL